jgi:hypothetical protein
MERRINRGGSAPHSTGCHQDLGLGEGLARPREAVRRQRVLRRHSGIPSRMTVSMNGVSRSIG